MYQSKATAALAAIMCPTFCMEEAPPLCEVEQVCDTTAFGDGTGNFPILPTPLALLDHSGGANYHIHSLPENPPTAVVPEPSSLAIMGLIGVIGLLTMRKKVCHVD
jgi:hypothetical protein